MMSIRNLDGEPVDFARKRSRFVLAIYQEWAGDNPTRLRQLAILQLVGCGWSQAEIGRALLSDRANIKRSIERGRQSIENWLSENRDRDDLLPLEYADFL